MTTPRNITAEEKTCIAEIQNILTGYQGRFKASAVSEDVREDVWWQMKRDVTNDLLKTLENTHIEPSQRLQNFKSKLGEYIGVPLPHGMGGAIETYAQLLAETRTTLGWKDTGFAILKAIVTVLATVTVVPTAIIKLTTGKHVVSHLFKVQGEEALGKVQEKLDALENKKNTPRIS
jgi:hypothetical protein